MREYIKNKLKNRDVTSPKQKRSKARNFFLMIISGTLGQFGHIRREHAYLSQDEFTQMERVVKELKKFNQLIREGNRK